MKNGYKTMMVLALSSSLLVGGCTGIENSGPNKESKTELPDTIAAQDEYTRSFLVSTDEVVEGHYVFKPWTEAYTMWIPVDGTLSQGFYEKREKHWERFSYAWLDNEENLSYGLFAQFEEIGLQHLSDYAQYEGE